MHKKDKEPPKYPEIGARLTQFIADSGEPNARQFALKAGLTPQLVSHLAAGNSIPGGETLVALARAYKDFDANWLLTGRGRALTPATPAPAVAQEPEPPRFTSGPETVSHATEIVLREVLLDRVAGLKEDVARLLEQNKELREQNSLLLGKPFDSPDAADESKEDEPTPPAPTTGVLPLPTLRVQTVRGLRPTACKD